MPNPAAFVERGCDHVGHMKREGVWQWCQECGQVWRHKDGRGLIPLQTRYFGDDPPGAHEVPR